MTFNTLPPRKGRTDQGETAGKGGHDIDLSGPLVIPSPKPMQTTKTAGGDTMPRFWALLLFPFLAGCASGGQGHWYDLALKDLRGENREVRGVSFPDGTTKAPESRKW